MAAPTVELAKPVIHIRAGRRALSLNLAELWSYRELLFFLAWRDVQVRYRQTALGTAWALLQPTLTAAIFTVLFSRFASMGSDVRPYQIVAYLGVMYWTFFANAVGGAGNSLVQSSYLVGKVYFPRILVPAAVVVSTFVDLLLSFLPLAAFLAYYRVPLRPGLLLLLPLALLAAGLAIVVGSILAAINVRYRDVRYALPFMLQVWMFASPVFYPLAFVPSQYRIVALLNPMTGVIEAARAVVFGTQFEVATLVGSAALLILGVPLALLVFHRTEQRFADMI